MTGTEDTAVAEEQDEWSGGHCWSGGHGIDAAEEDCEHRLVKPGRWSGGVSTVSLNRDDTDGVEGTGMTLEGCEHRLVKPG
ncbi:hypothetical protein K440DRAFT_626993 [Wilcoxina mikolae CBS 423.85]|nr:hypothetical protein K440DRAFT_626993 [Wilcoxina mikolae CBS 423.85]